MIRCDVRLSCGLVVTHRRLPNGATAAVPADGFDVPAHRDWWPEYCELIKTGLVPERAERPEDSAWSFGDPAPKVAP